jgi:hypothetical protein
MGTPKSIQGEQDCNKQMLSPMSSCTAQLYTSLHPLLVRQLSRPAADQQLAHQVVKMNGASPDLFFFGWSVASELCDAPNPSLNRSQILNK